MGIRGQLALFVSGLLAVSLVSLALLAAERERRERIEEVRLRYERVLAAIGVTAGVYLAQNDMAGLDTLVAHLSDRGVDPDLEEMAVLDSEGRIVAHSEPTRFGTLAKDPLSRRAVAGDGFAWELGDERLRISAPSTSGLRWGTVTAQLSLERLHAQVASSRRTWLWTALALAQFLGVALVIGLNRLVIRPVRVLQETTRTLGEGKLGVLVPPLYGKELGELGESVNRMARALKAQRDNLEAAVEERTRELRDANVRLEKLAITDGLTGAFNHRRFQEALAQEVMRSARTSRNLSVLMVDVDHFKRFNDTHGHPAGDELLRRLSATLGNGLRVTDLLARYGGEEFAILLPETGREEAFQVAERLRDSVERELGDQSRVTVSIGVATSGTDGEGSQAVLSAADRALYEAKRRGRNQVVAAGGDG